MAMDGRHKLIGIFRRARIGLSVATISFWPIVGLAQDGGAVYDKTCSGCHAKGVGGAPRTDDAAQWQARLTRNGYSGLFDSAIKGKGAMPAKGGNATLREDEVMSAVVQILRLAGVGVGGAAAPTATRVAKVAGVVATKGQSLFQANCAACHVAGVAGAPRLGDAAAWGPRMKGGVAPLLYSALKGKGAMPAKGGNASLTDADIKAAVEFMVGRVGVADTGKEVASVSKPEAPVSVPGAAKVTQTVPPQATPAEVPAGSGAAGVNAFNRLLPAAGKRNLPPPEDGIHDATNDATHLLQTPLQAYAGLPKSNAGNHIDWVKSLNEKKVLPRADKQDPKAEMATLELNIVREVKGSMPDVVYPHRQHTQWLDCSNCHPSIFIPQKGANQMSMASIILGQKCGVCHGKVAFPISECRLCHSKAKDPATISTGAGR